MSAYKWTNWILIISFDLFVVAAILHFYEKLQVHIQYAILIVFISVCCGTGLRLLQ